MEVLENNSHPKDSETQVSKSSYTFHHSQMNSSTRNKPEADINLLLACKVQLSSEVIKWKTETLRLQKERDSAHERNKELDQTIGELSEKAKELQELLIQAEAESRSLRSRSMCADEEKNALVQRLSQSFNCHSLPFPGRLQLSHQKLNNEELLSNGKWRESPKFHNEELSANEDWREVSQKMLQQMKREMKELEEMSLRFSEENKVNVTDDIDVDCKEELNEGLSSLLIDTESLKHHLLEQRQKLQSLIIGLGSDEQLQSENLNFQTAENHLESPSVNTQNSIPKLKSKKNKAHKFQMSFTKLETLEDLNKMARETSQFARNEKQVDLQAKNSSMTQNVTCHVSSPTKCGQKISASQTKVCPICQNSFDGTVSQTEFEEHVINHLEKESVSLLDQYVVL